MGGYATKTSSLEVGDEGYRPPSFLGYGRSCSSKQISTVYLKQEIGNVKKNLALIRL